MSLRWTRALGAVLALLGACDQWSLSFNSEGLFLSVSIVGDADLERGRYRLRTRNSEGAFRVLEVPQSGLLRLDGMAAGRYELTLLPPAGCSVSGPHPRSVAIHAGESAAVIFEVSCPS